MSKTVLIILAAVVVLIVIVVLTGMRYLRADDDDDFDGLSGDSGRSAPDDRPAGRGRARRGDDRDWREADDLPREAGMLAARTAQGRTAHGRTAHGRTVRGSAPQRSGRPYRRGQDDVDEPAPAGRRPGPAPDDRMARRGSRDYDDRPRQAMPAREYGPRDGRGARPTGSGRDQRDQDSRTGRDDLAKRASSRGNPRLDDRGLGDRRDDSAQSRRDDLLPPVRPRQGRGKRDGDGEWPSSEWDELSDVDYWAEVASDKPLTTTAQPAAPADRPGRPDARRDADSAPARDSRPGSGAQSDTGSKLPSRSSRPHSYAGQVPVAAPVGPVSEPGAAGPRRPGALSVPSSEPTLAMLASMGPKSDGSPAAGAADDDPLTSPSFPRIAADDSRSYRRSRSETRGQDARGQDARGQDARGPDGHGQAGHRQGASAQTQQLSGYPAGPSGKPGTGPDNPGQRSSTPPGGYSWPTGNGPDYAAASVADPYRSVPSGSSSQSGYPIPASPADSGGYRVPGPGGHPAPAAAGGGYPAAATGSYPAPDPGKAPAPASGAAGGNPVTASGGYLPPVSGGRDVYPADAVTRAYSAPAAAATGYQAGLATGYSDPVSASYPVPAPDHGGYPSASSSGVLPQSAPPVSAGYPPGPGPGAYPAPEVGGYSAGGASGTYSTARTSPVPAEPPLSYPGYGSAGLPGGSSPYLQNLAGSRGAAPGQGSEQASGYPGFPAGQPGQFAAAPAAVYSTQAPPLPVAPGNAGFDSGYPAAQGYPAGPDGYPAGQFGVAPYEPAGYPVPGHETGGYAGADPYALDPYGYPGYRNGGF